MLGLLRNRVLSDALVRNTRWVVDCWQSWTSSCLPLPSLPPPPLLHKKGALMWDPTICMGPPPSPQLFVFNQQFRGALIYVLQNYLGIFPTWEEGVFSTPKLVFYFDTKCTFSWWVCEDRDGRRHWARHNCWWVGDGWQPSWNGIKEKAKEHWYRPIFAHFVSLCHRETAGQSGTDKDVKVCQQQLRDGGWGRDKGAKGTEQSWC